MKIPELIVSFINKSISLENFCLPNFYPKKDLFEEFQIGYKVNGNSGEKITGEAEGDFQENWFVICSGYSNDPFFIDINEEDENFPIYFAWHGTGNWVPIKVSKNILEFTDQLNFLKELETNEEQIQEKLKTKIDIKNKFWAEVYSEYEEYDDE